MKFSFKKKPALSTATKGDNHDSNKERSASAATQQQNNAAISIPQNAEEFQIPVQPDTFKKQKNNQNTTHSKEEKSNFLSKDSIPDFLRADGASGKNDSSSTASQEVHDVFSRKDAQDDNSKDEEPEHGWINPSLFAQAMLKGMGFNPKDKQKHRFPEPVVPKPRMKLAGLGADQQLKEDQDDSKDPLKSTRSLEKFLLEREDADSDLKPSIVSKYDLVLITGGPYDGLCACVEDTTPDQRQRLKVKLNLPNRLIAQVKLENLKHQKLASLPANHESRQFARSIRIPKNTRLKDPMRLDLQRLANTSSSSSQPASMKQSSHSERTTTTSTTTQASRKRPREDQSSQGKPAKKKRRITWIIPNIQVRMVSKTFQKGKYYLQKAIVLDVPDLYSCSIKFENGAVFNDVPEKYLETVIPRKTGSVCVCVRGTHRNFRGQMLKKDAKKQKVILQRIHDDNDWSSSTEEEVVELSYDDVCHYVRGR